MPDGTSKFRHGAEDLATLLDAMWPAEPGVGRFGLPTDFGESTHPAPKLNERHMIYDPRVCDMPRTVAFRDEKHAGD
eukprot:1972578-Heterocapsa_arctica.AAC.1